MIVSGHSLRDVEWGMFSCNPDLLTRLDDSTSVWFPKNGLIGFMD
ncbi:hypothetical protein AGMMS49992_20310 [Clostridia bacterium]|nr:hypothetical protein AGMMS49992_20310 [Clostridia bacterium]